MSGLAGDLFSAMCRTTAGGYAAPVLDGRGRRRSARDADRPGDVTKLLADAPKPRRATGWRPQHDLDSGLRLNLEWLEEGARDE